jgi:hypothetical protein
MFDQNGGHLFPFYWTRDPRLIKGVDATVLTSYETEIISFINTFQLFDIKELLPLESDYPSLVLYLRKYFTFRLFGRLPHFIWCSHLIVFSCFLFVLL